MIKSTFTALIIAISISGFCIGQEANKPGGKKRNESNRQRPGMYRPGGNQQNGFQVEAIFKRLDKNSDGVLTADEVPERMKTRMKALDKDGSNSITIKEMSEAMQNQQRGGRFQQRNGNRGKKGNRDQAMGGKKMDGVQGAEFMFKRMDKNGDGVISKAEAPERMQEKFARIDKNGNDQLDKNEIVAVLEIMKAEGGKKGGRYNTDPSKTRPVEPKRPPRK